MIKIIENHRNYCIDTNGKVYRLRYLENSNEAILQELKPDYSTGHGRVRLNGENCYITKLVSDAFMNIDVPYGFKLFHIDGNNRNNSLENLIWLSPSDIQLYSTYTVEARKRILK